jgi:hypothetical protein
MDNDAANRSVVELKNYHTLETYLSCKPERIISKMSKISKVLSSEKIVDTRTQPEDINDKDGHTGSVMRPFMTMQKHAVAVPGQICAKGNLACRA